MNFPFHLSTVVVAAHKSWCFVLVLLFICTWIFCKDCCFITITCENSMKKPVLRRGEVFLDGVKGTALHPLLQEVCVGMVTGRTAPFCFVVPGLKSYALTMGIRNNSKVLELEMWGVHLWTSIYGEYVMSHVIRIFGSQISLSCHCIQKCCWQNKAFHDATSSWQHRSKGSFRNVSYFLLYSMDDLVQLVWVCQFVSKSIHPKRSSSNIHRPLSGLIPPKKFNPLSMNPILKYSEPPTTLHRNDFQHTPFTAGTLCFLRSTHVLWCSRGEKWRNRWDAGKEAISSEMGEYFTSSEWKCISYMLRKWSFLEWFWDLDSPSSGLLCFFFVHEERQGSNTLQNLDWQHALISIVVYIEYFETWCLYRYPCWSVALCHKSLFFSKKCPENPIASIQWYLGCKHCTLGIQ